VLAADRIASKSARIASMRTVPSAVVATLRADGLCLRTASMRGSE
jgi:hypothetical protein